MPEDINFQQAMEAVGIKPLFLDENSNVAEELDKLVRRPTNVEFMVDMMEFCPFGALGQVIVVGAVEAYARQIVETPLEELAHPLIDPEAYKKCAEWMLGQYKQRYGS